MTFSHMEEIERILAQNEKHRLDDPIPETAELDQVEKALGRRLPHWYRAFVEFGGLNDLRFSAEVFGPNELLSNQQYPPNQDYVAFASNGCGDLFCWAKSGVSAIYVWDHESGIFSEAANDFIQWLRQNRF